MFKHVFSTCQTILQIIRFYNKNRYLFIYPILSIVVTTILFAIGFKIVSFQYPNHSITATLILIFVLFMLISYIALLFQATLVTALLNELLNTPKALNECFKITLSNSGSIFIWSVISGTIGLILKVLEKLSDQHAIFEFFFAALCFGWAISTMFVLPIVIMENVSTFDAIKKSQSIFGKSWKKVIKINAYLFGIECILFVAFLMLLSNGKGGEVPITGLQFMIVLFFFFAANTLNSLFDTYLACLIYLRENNIGSIDSNNQQLLEQTFKHR